MPSSVQALEGDTGGDASSNADSGISTYAVTPTVGISLPSSINLSVLPTPTGATTYTNSTLTITTTNSASYSIYLYTNGDSSLKSTNSANTSTVDAINNGDVGLTLSSLENNTWGYSLSTEQPSDNTTYKGVPTSNNTPILTQDTSSTNTANDTYNLTIGAKVDTTIPSGTYTNTITVAVVAEPPAITSLTELTYMQDMTSDICATSQVNDTTRLIDRRDGKYYWVAKLKDGNCWMTQNLDFDIPAEGLTPDTSDVTTAWDSSSTYPPQATSTTIFNNSDVTGTYSWDPCMYVNSDPGNYVPCNNDSTTMTSCEKWINVGSMTAMTEENTSSGTISGDEYDAHYLVGNFYQWNAATAGSGGATQSPSDSQIVNAGESICPHGWRLPFCGESYNNASGSFYNLLNQYGLINSYNSTAIVSPPLYFNTAGNAGGGRLAFSGNYGTYWSSSANTSISSAYRLIFEGFYAVYVTPSSSSSRYTGSSVRCMVIAG